MILTPTPTPATFAEVSEALNRDHAMRATLTPPDRFNLLIDRTMTNVADMIVCASAAPGAQVNEHVIAPGAGSTSVPGTPVCGSTCRT